MSKSKQSIAWQPTATLHVLEQRAEVINRIRQFFAKRAVLEVDTPLLSHATVTDPYIASIPVMGEEILYLQTSPEYAMKRLLAMGSGSIYQISKAFRQGDLGRFHNPEFTLLEWYRVDFTHHDLMDEVDELLQWILHTPPAERLSYGMAFEKFLEINPHTASLLDLRQCAERHAIQFASVVAPHDNEVIQRNMWLTLLLTHCIEPHIGQTKPIFLYDFPITQAALAQIRQTEIPPVASRFEVYFKNIELANGFHELQNATEQRQRFEADLVYRQQQGYPSVPLDERFLAALQAGLPACAGVALGVDRLVMLALKKQTLTEVLSFGFEIA